MRKFVASTVVHAAVLSTALVILAFWVFPFERVNRTLDLYAIGAALIMLTRYLPSAWQATRTRWPSPGQTIAVALCGMVVTITGFRSLRIAGFNLGGPDMGLMLATVFAILTSLLVFSITLLATAPEVRGRRLTPWAAVLLAVVVGTIINLMYEGGLMWLAYHG
jgi:hypothetical protein